MRWRKCLWRCQHCSSTATTKLQRAGLHGDPSHGGPSEWLNEGVANHEIVEHQNCCDQEWDVLNNDLRQFLRNRVTEAKHSHTIPPLHLPSTKLVCKKHPPLQQILHKWGQAHTTWQPNQEATCTCAQLQSAASPDHIYNNHIAIQLAEFQPQHSFLAYSGKGNILPKHSQLAHLTRSIRSWRRHYHIPFNSAATKQFVNQQLAQHRDHDRKHLNIQMIKHVQQQLPSGIIHCEDHFPNRHMWYCPALYNQAISATFLDADAFRTSTTTPLTHHFDVFTSITTLLPDYTWAFKQWGRIPQAYILPKRKKKFGKGRPIVAFLDTIGRKL